MRVLVACERSGVVRRAFRAKGHEAWSCDIEPADDGSPHHIQGDVLNVLDGVPWPYYRDSFWPSMPWELMIAFPPCTDLAVSGARWFKDKRADGRQQQSIEFAKKLWSAPIEKKALENPVGILSTEIRKPDQIIQPHQFGHPEFKATFLWLDGLPKLKPTNQLEIPSPLSRERETWEVCWRMAPGPERARLRSQTYEGIGQAMADQWG